MNNIVKIVTASLGVIFVLFGLVYVNGRNQTTLGSINDGQAYNSTSTDVIWTPAKNNVVGGAVLKNSPGTLGSIVITTATAGTLTLYDATSTNTNAATTTLAKMGASVAAGTYTFDAVFYKGLVAEFTAAVGAASSTITWR